jgi:hypothetical protein
VMAATECCMQPCKVSCTSALLSLPHLKVGEAQMPKGMAYKE